MTWSAWRLLLAMLSCVLLAWSLQRALHGIAFDAPAEFTYTVTAPHGAPRNPAAAAGEIWLRYVYVDGREQALRDLARTGNWQDAGFALVHRGDTEPAAVSVRGRQVTACFLSTKWGGIVRVEGASGAARDVDLFRDQEAPDLACVDLAGGRVASPGSDRGVVAFRVLLALLPLLVVGAVWQPWKTPARLEGWLLLCVSLLHLLVWLTRAIGYNSDAIGYVTGLAASRPTAFPPGYPVFVGVWQLIFPGFVGSAVAAAQHIFMVLSLFALQRMARPIMPPDLASLGFLVAGTASPTLFLPQAILSENVALFTMAAVLWLASQRKPDGAWRRDLGAGLVLSFATLTRIVPLPALAIPLFLIFAVEHGFAMRTLARTARVLVVAAAFPALLTAWYWRQTGSFALTTSTGFHTYNRVVTEQVLIDREGEATRRFLGIVGERPLAGVPHWEIRRDLERHGLGYVEQERLLRAVAREGFWTAPFAFAAHSVIMTSREYAANPMTHIPSSADVLRVRQLDDEPVLGLRSSALMWRDDLDELFAGVWRVVRWAPLVGVMLVPLLPGPGRLTFLALLAVPGGYLFASSLVEFFLERYVAAVMPFILVLTPMPVAALLTLGRRK